MPNLRSAATTGLALLLAVMPLVARSTNVTESEYRSWIEEMKTSERGPFERIRWFCKDGTVLPPRAYACGPHGGGHQHGEWSAQTRELRDNGYLVANLLAGIEPERFLAHPSAHEAFAQILIERYLIRVDDGWILRRALFYRGAVQEEDERKGARALLNEMAARSEWIGPRFTALRAGAALLPHGPDSASAQKVRQLSASLSDRNDDFKPLRAKIHGAPEATDADRVRSYAAGLPETVRGPYLGLAAEIDRLFREEPLYQELGELAGKYISIPWLQKLLRDAADSLRQDRFAENRFLSTAALLADLRDALPRIRASAARLEMIDLGLRVENEHFRAASLLRAELADAPRNRRVAWLRGAGQAAYGTGVLNARLRGELEKALDALDRSTVRLDNYRGQLNYLGRTPGWGTQTLRMQFFESMEKLARIEPLAMLFIQDQLRGSPLLFYAQVLDGLARDASRLAGVQHLLFGEPLGFGLTALNPGLATGILQVEADSFEPRNLRPDGIYVLPETVSELPPISGILTAGEGNPLSHIQLLARNLGIPNVTVDSSLLETLSRHHGKPVVLAVSSSGLVELAEWDDRWAGVFSDKGAAHRVRIEPDMQKLDLSVRSFVSLDTLRASDSGRIVGPKAANLGELRARYPGKVARGLAIPFGRFRQEVLDRPHPAGGSVFEWTVKRYRKLDEFAADDPARTTLAEAFRAELYEVVARTNPGQSFRDELQMALREVFGSGTLPGLFVRSDTNVEDLPGFTGAGLNLTLPNVVGFDNLVESIVRVWASPFSQRAFAWRQSHMAQPEHVYTSILLLESVSADKSGVLVTQDIDSGDPGVLSVAVNEGVGGAVEGQAAESLRIPLDGSPLRVLATATAPWQRLPHPRGGLLQLSASGGDTVLQPGEIDQLIELATGLPEKFPPIIDDYGNPAPADIEFGFINGRLRLFQLRPFLDSKRARNIAYLQEMEASLKVRRDDEVDMSEVPE